MAHYANIISFNDVKAASRSRFAQSRDGERNVFEEEEAAQGSVFSARRGSRQDVRANAGKASRRNARRGDVTDEPNFVEEALRTTRQRPASPYVYYDLSRFADASTRARMNERASARAASSRGALGRAGANTGAGFGTNAGADFSVEYGGGYEPGVDFDSEYAADADEATGRAKSSKRSGAKGNRSKGAGVSGILSAFSNLKGSGTSASTQTRRSSRAAADAELDDFGRDGEFASDHHAGASTFASRGFSRNDFTGADGFARNDNFTDYSAYAPYGEGADDEWVEYSDISDADYQPQSAAERRRQEREERRRERTKARADRMFSRQFGDEAGSASRSNSASQADQADGAPRAALYEGRMGSKQRKAASMQRASQAGSAMAKINPAGWFSNIKMSRGRMRAVTAVLCLALAVVFLYTPAQHYYQAQREHDRLATEYASIEQRNAALDQQNTSLASNAGMEDAVRQKYGFVVDGEETAVVSGLSETAGNRGDNVEANVLSSSVKAPEEWYTPYLDALFGVQ